MDMNAHTIVNKLLDVLPNETLKVGQRLKKDQVEQLNALIVAAKERKEMLSSQMRTFNE